MEATKTRIPGLILFAPVAHRDHRGFFSRTFDVQTAVHAGIDPSRFLQDSVSRSGRGVVRGLHVRTGEGESKLVRCSAGAIYDVVLDLRRSSATYRQWVSFQLDGDTQRSIYVPAGCAHGFQALTGTADTSYRIDREHDSAEDLTIAWNDPELAIPWPLPAGEMSDNDRNARSLKDLESELRRIRSM